MNNNIQKKNMMKMRLLMITTLKILKKKAEWQFQLKFMELTTKKKILYQELLRNLLNKNRELSLG